MSEPPHDFEPHAYEGRDLEVMAFARNYHRWISDEFRPVIHGDVAEVGAGDGRFAQHVLEFAPRSLTLFEPSREMHARQAADLARDPRVRRENATLAQCAPDFRGAFDCIVYNNVLEHVADDAAEVALMHQSLKPGGAVCLFVPALPMLMSDFDRSIGHLRRYTRPRLRQLLEQAGFAVERLDYLDALGVLPWLLVMTWGRGRLSQRKVDAYDRLAVPLVRRMESLLRPPFGKSLLAVARRH